MNAAPVVHAKNISLTFGGASPVVDNFNLDVCPSEIMTILGPSGVGKSSILRVLAGLQRPAAGQVFVNQAPLQQPHPLVAMAFQHPALLPWLTVRQNVAFGLNFKSQSRSPDALSAQRVDDALADVGLTDAAGKYPDQISGGMAQRAALARCLARQPQVLLLDEPFGALDEVTRVRMQTLLLQLRQRHKLAVVLVTHDIDEALLVSDRVGLLAGAPASLTHQWLLGRADHLAPRDLLQDTFVAQRVEMLKALRQGMTAGSTRESGQAALSTSRSNPTPAAAASSRHTQPQSKEYAHVL